MELLNMMRRGGGCAAATTDRRATHRATLGPMLRLALVAGAVLVACKKTKPEPETRTVTTPARATDAVPIDATPTGTAPPPDKLEVCAQPSDREPLAALCTLGRPGAQAVYDCVAPRPLMFCRGAVQWTCFRNGPAGETSPPVQLSAYLASDAPQPTSGQIIDTASMKRDGEIVGVEVEWTEADDARGADKVRALVGRLGGWGCVVTREYSGSFDMDCGTWTAEITYNDIIDRVILDAQLPGRFRCK
jgi:hypothetical protein